MIYSTIKNNKKVTAQKIANIIYTVIGGVMVSVIIGLFIHGASTGLISGI